MRKCPLHVTSITEVQYKILFVEWTPSLDLKNHKSRTQAMKFEMI